MVGEVSFTTLDQVSMSILLRFIILQTERNVGERSFRFRKGI